MRKHSNLIKSLHERCAQRPGTVAFPESQDPRVLEAAQNLLQEGLAREVWLVGTPINGLVQSSPKGLRWTVTDRPNLLQETTTLIKARLAARGKTMSEHDLQRNSADPLWQSAALLALGVVETCVAGAVATTADVIRAALGVIGTAPGISTVSGAFIMHRHEPQKPIETFVFADCGVVVSPTAAQLKDIALSSCETWRALAPLIHPDYPPAPVVAFLSFSTKGSAKHPDADKVIDAVKQFKHVAPTVTADGEMQFDAAFDAAIGARKAPGSMVPGKANVWVFPDLDAGNIGYKITQRLAEFEAYGPLLQGLALPMSDLSRGASVDDIMTVACLLMQKAAKNLS